MAVEAATGRSRKWWGWGYEDQQVDQGQLEGIAAAVRERIGFGGDRIEEPVPADAIELPEPRLRVPDGLEALFSSERYDRLSHAMGKAYRDVVRGFRGRVDNPPDLVAFPESAEDVDAVLALCADEGAAAIPYGGGTSVVGGVEPRVGDGYRGVVTIDLGRMARVIDVDPFSRAARIQAGASGPALEDQLRERGLTLRHFPQSFEFSTLGGWIATRAGGHFATLYTHIDDLVESVRVITPTGEWQSRRLPGSGAGPSPDRMMLGSEGILGVIVEAWVRVQERPTHKGSCGVAFERFDGGAEAVREISQSGLNPANCRLLDAEESAITGAGPPGRALLVLGFESAHHPVDDSMGIALEVARSHGGEPGEVRGGERTGTPQPRPGARRANPPAAEAGSDPVGSWRHAFLAAPYLRDSLIACGVLTDTFETAITWDRFADFHAEVMEAARRAAAEVSGTSRDEAGVPRLSCRFTHVYPDGPAPYYTIYAPARRGGEVEQWDEIKAAVSEVVIEAGGTITHHHAIGRDHRPWYDRQRPDPFAAALRGAKAEVDPSGILNPGVLIGP
jgi:alkyldihydroxyacetonephosphate synthase